jgi:hypothetical protein
MPKRTPNFEKALQDEASISAQEDQVLSRERGSNNPHGSVSDVEKSEKQRRWDEIAARLERVVDGIGKPIDQGIKEGVLGLNALGINTTGSCEGHPDWGTYAPYIDIEGEGVEDLDRQLRALEDKPENYSQGKQIFAEIERRNLEERKKLQVLLDAFYRGRATTPLRQLFAKKQGWERSRLESHSADSQKTEPEEIRNQRLLEYQGEMRAFVDFLREKYFTTP